MLSEGLYITADKALASPAWGIRGDDWPLLPAAIPVFWEQTLQGQTASCCTFRHVTPKPG
ncbi:hypothetical protein C4F51_17405 [Cellvibrio sp. KB43]|uniref:Uncharacterized protein n=1 Tax=Cellvibrio polysaccharolyticus TaxID=2082724 RepID=A0A928V8A2_9GAMM|nr:hypothetical protein [Cellvibrio polysaccharolyticus]